MHKLIWHTLVVLAAVLPYWVNAAVNTSRSSMQEDTQHIRNWNQFADDLYAYHKHIISTHRVRTEERVGGYAGNKEFYREVSYYDADQQRLLSRIQWERDNPQQIHVIEVYLYNEQGELKFDYLAAYLPEFRNAPIQTLINAHYHNDELHSFRQFDASGNRIYEQCKGRFFNEPVFISLEEDDLWSQDRRTIGLLESEEYLGCFEYLHTNAEPFLSPLKVEKISAESATEYADAGELQEQLKQLNLRLQQAAEPARLYIERGQLYFQLHEFEKAVADYDKALALDKTLDDAYFGRGMAKGRLGQVQQGIDDLSVFIKRNPQHSRAYTKRGVRYIWLGKLDKAREDLTTAIKLDPGNAEAHDDLGVLYAHNKQYTQAIKQFKRVVNIDPSYQKGFHNLAMAYHIVGEKRNALDAVNTALNIQPNERNSLLLKGEILNSLAMFEEAKAVTERAEFLPEGNWSERFTPK